MTGKTVNQYEQKRQLPGIKEARPEYKDSGSQVLQDATLRVDRAFKAFFRRQKAGLKGGFPRLRGQNR